MDVTDRVHARTILTTFQIIGARPIAAITDDYEHADRVSRAGRDLGAPAGALPAAIAAALNDNRDPSADPEVQRIVISNQIANEATAAAIDGMVWDQLREVCRQKHDTIVTAWRKPFDAAVAALTTAHQNIGDVPLDDTDTIMRRGGEVASWWSQAVGAVKVVQAAGAGWLALGEFTRTAQNDPAYPVLRIADVDYQTWMRLELHRRRLPVWDAVMLGLDLSLPTVAQYRARVAAIESAGVQAGADAEELAKDQRGRRRDLVA